MADRTEIAWCDSTFNPWEGCTKVGPGCDHCYAEARNARFGGGTAGNWGPGAPRRRTTEAYWRQPLQWNREAFYECATCGWRGHTKYGPAVCCEEPARVVRRRVFCASLADVFDNEVDPQWRADLFELICATPNLDWLLLTKRIGNVRSMVPSTWNESEFHRDGWPPNVWLGATIVNQEELARDVAKLLAIPSAARFLSIEPLLGPIDLRCVRAPGFCPPYEPLDALRPNRCIQHAPGHCLGGCPWRMVGVDWVVVGGESGHGARPMHPDWARALRDQCAAAGVPFLFKQWGEWAPQGDDDRIDKHPFGMFAGASFFPDKVVIGGSAPMHRRGKKAAGRQLDGALHNAFPRSA